MDNMKDTQNTHVTYNVKLLTYEELRNKIAALKTIVKEYDIMASSFSRPGDNAILKAIEIGCTQAETRRAKLEREAELAWASFVEYATEHNLPVPKKGDTVIERDYLRDGPNMSQLRRRRTAIGATAQLAAAQREYRLSKFMEDN